MINDDAAHVTEVTAGVREAMLARDWDRLHLMLHPYLHWTAANDSQVRGRTKVIAWLQNAAHLEQPIAVELRDGQIYRWREPPES
jgi:hypothetical protein